jgi:hypothetical protein
MKYEEMPRHTNVVDNVHSVQDLAEHNLHDVA